MIIFFLICGASSVGLLIALLLTTAALFDSEHRLLAAARLRKHSGKKEDILMAGKLQ
jgi:hypothetical protein